jgi:CBS domain containing-hemolysin-like protein
MLEMACVSFNRVRLQYLVQQGQRRASWLNTLIGNPSRLFGTTLIGVNVALQVGSECSRLFYSALALPPAIAPLSQVLLVLIFAELAPMFAARRYAEHVSMLGVPVIYASSIVLKPVTWSFSCISRAANRLMGASGQDDNIFITRDELQRVFEEPEDDTPPSGATDDSSLVANIFALRTKTVGQVLEPLSAIPMLPSNVTVGGMRELLQHWPGHSFIPIYHRTRRNIVGIAFPRDLIRCSDQDALLKHARAPWFLTRTARILRVLKQFRQNKQSLAVILSDKGSAMGIVTLDGIVSEVFGPQEGNLNVLEPESAQHRFIEKTFPAETAVAEFNERFHADLPIDKGESLEALMEQVLGHEPEEGESLRIGGYELTAEGSPRIGPRHISVRSRPH